MKVDITKTKITPHYRRHMTPGAGMRADGRNKLRKSAEQNNYGNINTSIKSNSDARVSFKGDAAAQAAETAKPLLYRCADFAKKNPIAADALFVFPITCCLKPFTLLSMAKTEEQKKKYRYQAAKAIASGLAGLGMAFAIGSIIKNGVAKAKNNKAFKIPEKVRETSEQIVKSGVQKLKELAQSLSKKPEQHSELISQIEKVSEEGKINLDVFYNDFEKIDKKSVKSFLGRIEEVSPETAEKAREAIEEQKFLDSYESAAKNTADKLFQPIFLPLRSRITFLTIPLFLSLVGLKKPAKCKTMPDTPARAFGSLNHEVFKDSNCEKLFQPFLEGRK